MMTGSSLYSRAATIHMSKPSRAMIADSTVSSRSRSHVFRTSARARKGKTRSRSAIIKLS